MCEERRTNTVKITEGVFPPQSPADDAARVPDSPTILHFHPMCYLNVIHPASMDNSPGM